jgi:hypothetical protein
VDVFEFLCLDIFPNRLKINVLDKFNSVKTKILLTDPHLVDLKDETNQKLT